MMCSIALWFSDSSDDSDEKSKIQMQKLRRKQIRDNTNPMEMSPKDFIKNFRLSKNAFMDVLTEIDDKLFKSIRSTSVPNILKLAITLKFLGDGLNQGGFDKDSFGLAQPTVSSILKDVINVLEKHICRQYIDFQYTEEESEEVEDYFKKVSGIPGVIGVVDTFHAKIIAPEKKVQHLYYGSKGYSIKTMIVCDHKMVIRYVNAKHPGASEDSSIFESSTLKTYLENNYKKGRNNSWLLGDANFELMPYLMTPYRSAKMDPQKNYYNWRHSKARTVMSNTISALKSRFQCLSEKKLLHYTPKKASQIINVCAALHNICCAFSLPPPASGENMAVEESDDDDDNDSNAGGNDSDLDLIEDDVDAENIRSGIVKLLQEKSKSLNKE